MSVKSSIFYGNADNSSSGSDHWSVYANHTYRPEGLFVDVEKAFGPVDGNGYQDLEVGMWERGARVIIRLPLEVCEAIANHMEERKRWRTRE